MTLSVTPGSGAALKSDLDSGEHVTYHRIDGSALTALQLIDDPVIATGSAVPAKIFFVGGTDGTNARAIATTAAGVVKVDDNGASLTVDNGGTFAVQVDGAALTSLQLLDDVVATDGAAAVTKLLQIGGTDGTNAQIISLDTTGRVNLAAGKAEDAAHANGDIGVYMLGHRRDADTSPVDADGDYHGPIFDNAGNLKVNIKAGAGAGGTALADGAVFTPDTTSLTPIGGMRDDTSPATVTEGDAGVCRITTNRALHVNLRDASGTEYGTSSSPLPVVGRTAVELVPTMGTELNGVYGVNQFVGGKLTVSNVVPVSGGSGLIHSVRVHSKKTQVGSFDVYFFNADPSNSGTMADNTAVQVNSADLTKLIGVAHCSDVTSHGTGSTHSALNLGMAFKLASGTTMYAAVVCRFALDTDSTSDILLAFTVLPD